MREELVARRKVEDADMMRRPSEWPALSLHLKTQPWWEGERDFAILMRGGPPFYVVKKEGGAVETYETIDEIVEKWSVD